MATPGRGLGPLEGLCLQPVGVTGPHQGLSAVAGSEQGDKSPGRPYVISRDLHINGSGSDVNGDFSLDERTLGMSLREWEI